MSTSVVELLIALCVAFVFACSMLVAVALVGVYLSRRSREGIVNRRYWLEHADALDDEARRGALHRLIMHADSEGRVNIRMMSTAEDRRREPKPRIEEG